MVVVLPTTLGRVAVLLSCTFLGLICGTMYLYSSYSPQLAERLNFSVTDSSKIALAGTIGVAIAGPISGIVVDKTGYTRALIVGGLSILVGYVGLKKQFDRSYSNLQVSYFLLFLVGSGSTFINASCLKCCAVSFPSIRGVATSLPLALYGLSALFYSVIGSVFFPGDTSNFLGFLAYSSLVIFGICAPSIIMTDREHLLRKATLKKATASTIEMAILSSPRSTNPPSPMLSPRPSGSVKHIIKTLPLIDDEIETGNIFYSPKFWIIFLLTGFLAAMGQMYIYSVGYIVKALVRVSINVDASTTDEAKQKLEALIQTNQQLQVGLLSTTNCLGRLVSGICGDIISQSFNKRRSWLLFVPAIGFTVTQLIGYQLEDYNKLAVLSLLTGFFYGFTFCIMPIIIGDIFGMDNFSLNWGYVGLAPILPSFYFTKLFGNIFDSNSVSYDDGSHACVIGKSCYNSIFKLDLLVTVCCVIGVCVLNFAHKSLTRSKNDYKRAPSTPTSSHASTFH